MFSESYLREKKIPFWEFYPLVLWSAFGAMVMASTKNLLMIFLGLEVLSIALYVMAGMSRTEQKSEESAIKYFLLGAFASGFLLYGIAFIYGGTGNIHLDLVKYGWGQGTPGGQGLILFGLGMMLIGLCFKASFVPFHQWTPDVYQGAPTNVTAFMATVSKIGAFGALFRVLDACAPFKEYWIPALGVIAVLTMTIGNLVALTQRDVKRILGYSSIAHAGYILVGILAYFKLPDDGTATIQTVVYYLLSYLLMTAGAFAVISLTAKNGREGTNLKDLNGLYQRSPLGAAALVVFVASLIGIPPLAGFVGKYGIFRDALAANLTWLAIALAINSVLSIAYYLAIAHAAFVGDEGDAAEVARPSIGISSATLICMIGVIAAGILANPLSQFLVGR
jgi:NADH-quinone oxidoreductase subunit N